MLINCFFAFHLPRSVRVVGKLEVGLLKLCLSPNAGEEKPLARHEPYGFGEGERELHLIILIQVGNE